ncbi:MAG: S-layer family protein [Merismopedia sp. SIO2A8]|nr:S-layer family protein [Merismopedia sp. SIO2A8]
MGNLDIAGGSQIASNAFGLGDAGDVTVSASGDVTISGADATLGDRFEAVRAAIVIELVREATDNNIALSNDDAVLQAFDNATALIDLVGFAEGTDSGSADAFDPDVAPSGIQSRAEFGNDGPLSGNIILSGGMISLRDGAEINSESNNSATDSFSTVGLIANNGNITINNSTVNTTNNGAGFAGNISLISPANVRIENSSQISSEGNLGFIFIGDEGNVIPESILVSSGSQIRTDNENVDGFGGTGTQEAGQISFDASDDIRVTGRSTVIASRTFNEADAGNIFFEAGDVVAIRGGANLRTTVASGASGDGGQISIASRAFRLVNDAQLQTQVNEGGVGNSGNVFITTDGATIIRNRSTIFSSIGDNVAGDGGQISIEAGSFRLSNGAQLQTQINEVAQGDAGNIFITVGGPVEISNESTIFSSLQANAQGNAGNIRIEGRSLQLLNNSQIQNQVDEEARGNAGTLIVLAQDEVLLDNSVIFSSIGTRARGQAEFIVIGGRTPMDNNGSVEAITPTQSAIFRNGAQLNANTAGINRNSRAGSAFIVAESILFDGVNADGFPTAVFSGVTSPGEGEGGDIIIVGEVIFDDAGVIFNPADSLTIKNGALLTVSSFGFSQGRSQGLARDEAREQRAGNIFISTRLLDMDNDEFRLNGERGIFAETGLGGGGNVDLNIGELLLLRGATRISTTAGRSVEPGDGGNITISTSDDGFIIAQPFENNDITADSVVRQAGRVEVNAEQAFGLFFRSRGDLSAALSPDDPLDPDRLPTSDVTSVSQFDASLDGQLLINLDGIDPSRGLSELPSGLVDGSDLIAEVCPTGPGASDRLGNFSVTGRGGLPPGPHEIFDVDDLQTDWVEYPNAPNQQSPGAGTNESLLPPTDSQPIVEAQGWHIGANNQVTLVASETEGATERSPIPHASSCSRP